MRKELLLLGTLVVTLAVALYLISRSGTEVKEENAASVTAQPSPQKELPKSAVEPSGEIGGSKRDKVPAQEAKRKKPESPAAATTPEKTPEETMRLALPEEKSVRVNDTPVTIGNVVPPGVLKPGDEMPEDASLKFMNLAIEQQLLVQEAKARGLADAPEYQGIVEDMKNDLAEMQGLSEEQKQWRLEQFSKMALINELYRKEGLIPERVSREEVDQYYETYGGYEYDSLREREASKGTPQDKIEKMIKRQIKRDLEARLNKDLNERKSAYLDTLREQSDIR